MLMRRPWEDASPSLMDRLLAIKSDDDDSGSGAGEGAGEEKDLSEDSGQGEDEGKGKGDGEGQGEGKGEDGKDAEQALLDEYDESLNEEELTYKKRFADTKDDRDALAKQLRATMLENEQLRKKAGHDTAETPEDEAKMVEALTEDIWSEVSTIEEKDPNKRLKEVYKTIAKKMVKGQKAAVDAALAKIQQVKTEETKQAEIITSRRANAEKMARIALKEEGLDPVKHLPLMQREVDRQMAQDKDWFEAIPADQQFVKLAKRVAERLKKIRADNDEHRKDAGGSMGAGSRRKLPSKGKGEDESDEADTMSGAMAMHDRQLRAKSSKLYELTRR